MRKTVIVNILALGLGLVAPQLTIGEPEAQACESYTGWGCNCSCYSDPTLRQGVFGCYTDTNWWTGCRTCNAYGSCSSES